MRALQVDYLAIPARELVPILIALPFENPKEVNAIHQLKNWDYKLSQNSIAATIYQEWENQLEKNIIRISPIPTQPTISTKLIIDYIKNPDLIFSQNSIKERDELMKKAMSATIDVLEKRLGLDIHQWQYGQVNNKHVYLSHALSQKE
jgi:penicillin amidase